MSLQRYGSSKKHHLSEHTSAPSSETSSYNNIGNGSITPAHKRLRIVESSTEDDYLPTDEPQIAPESAISVQLLPANSVKLGDAPDEGEDKTHGAIQSEIPLSPVSDSSNFTAASIEPSSAAFIENDTQTLLLEETGPSVIPRYEQLIIRSQPSSAALTIDNELELELEPLTPNDQLFTPRLDAILHPNIYYLSERSRQFYRQNPEINPDLFIRVARYLYVGEDWDFSDADHVSDNNFDLEYYSSGNSSDDSSDDESIFSGCVSTGLSGDDELY